MRDDPPKQAEPVAPPTENPLAPPSMIPLEIPSRPDAGNTLQLAIDASGNVTINGAPAKRDADIEAAAIKAVAKDPATSATITASVGARHGRVIAVLDLVRRGGIGRVGFVIDRDAAPAAP